MANGGKIRKGKRDEALLSSLTSRRVASLEGLGYFRAPMHDPLHINVDALYAGLDSVKLSPSAAMVLDMIVRRPTVEGRELLTAAQLDETNGLVGDSWFGRGSSKTPDGSANPDAQLTIVNSRAISLIAGTRGRWALAGDQLFF